MENENMELMEIENEEKDVEMDESNVDDIETVSSSNNVLTAVVVGSLAFVGGVIAAKVAKPIGEKLKANKDNPKRAKKGCKLFRRKKDKGEPIDVDYEEVDTEEKNSKDSEETPEK